MRPADRLPDLFVEAVQRPEARRGRRPSCCAAAPGFHVLKLVERKDGGAFTRRPVARAPHPAAALGRAERRGGGAPSAPVQARHPGRRASASSSSRARTPRTPAPHRAATSAGPRAGSFVPEFEEAMAALPVGGISDPVTTRFGAASDPGRRPAPDRRSTPASCASRPGTSCASRSSRRPYAEWLRDLRGRAYIELREPPQ